MKWCHECGKGSRQNWDCTFIVDGKRFLTVMLCPHCALGFALAQELAKRGIDS